MSDEFQTQNTDTAEETEDTAESSESLGTAEMSDDALPEDDAAAEEESSENPLLGEDEMDDGAPEFESFDDKEEL